MKIKPFIIALALSSIGTFPSYGTLLTYEGFDYTSGSNVTGLSGGGSTGWRTSSNTTWTTNGTTGTVAAAGLSYSGYSAGETTNLATDGLAVTVTAQRNHRYLAIDAGGIYATNGYRDSSSNLIGGSLGGSKTLYGSFLVSSTDWSASRMIFELNHNSTAAQGIRIDQSSNGGAFRLMDTSGGTLSGSGATPSGNNTYLIAWQLDFSDISTSDQFKFWVNPSASDTPPSGGISLTSARDISFTNLEIRSVAGTLTFDEIRIGTAWGDVAPAAIPEPSTWLGLVVGTLVWCGRKVRRKRS